MFESINIQVDNKIKPNTMIVCNYFVTKAATERRTIKCLFRMLDRTWSTFWCAFKGIESEKTTADTKHARRVRKKERL